MWWRKKGKERRNILHVEQSKKKEGKQFGCGGRNKKGRKDEKFLNEGEGNKEWEERGRVFMLQVQASLCGLVCAIVNQQLMAE